MFFSHLGYGDVIEAKIARNYYGTLLDYTNLASMQALYLIERRKNELKGNKPSKKLARIERKILNLRKSAAKKLENKDKSVKKVILIIFWVFDN